MQHKALVFIPTYNEKDNIGDLVSQILNLNLGIDILVVDDDSPDGTGGILDEISKIHPNLSVIHRFESRGRGLAGIAGFKYAIKQDVDYIIELDADHSHDPNYIPLFLKEIENCDVVIGSRKIRNAGIIGSSLQRRCLTFFAWYFCRFILGINISDATSGFRCFKRSVLESIDLNSLKSTGPSIVEEINLRIQKKGFKVKEIPIIAKPRQGGSSKLNLIKTIDTLYTLLKVRFRE